MKKRTIVLIELGMLGGIVLALFTVPENTPLLTFVLASGVCFLIGNILLYWKIKAVKTGQTASEAGAWPHLIRAFAILGTAWIAMLLLRYFAKK